MPYKSAVISQTGRTWENNLKMELQEHFRLKKESRNYSLVMRRGPTYHRSAPPLGRRDVIGGDIACHTVQGASSSLMFLPVLPITLLSSPLHSRIDRLEPASELAHLHRSLQWKSLP
jgi:hypothetical protein